MANIPGFKWWDGSVWQPECLLMSISSITPGVTPPVSTTTSMSSSATTIDSGSSATLTITVTPTASDGTVQVQSKVGSGAWTNYKSAVSKPGGTASVQQTANPTVDTNFRAVFTPTSSTAYTSSTSSSLLIQVTGAEDHTVWGGGTSNLLQAYDGDNTKRSGWSGDTLYYGTYSSVHGAQHGLVIFSSAERAEMRDIDPDKLINAYVTFYNNHTYQNSGGTVKVSPYTTQTSIPNTCGIPTGGTDLSGIPKTGSVTKSIPLSMGQRFCSGGDAYGLVFSQTTSAIAGYGYLNGSTVKLKLIWRG